MALPEVAAEGSRYLCRKIGHSLGTGKIIAGGKHLRLTVNKNPQATNLTYTVETCAASP